MHGPAQTSPSEHEKISIGLLADFNAQNFAVLLQKAAQSNRVDCVRAPFGQTVNLLLDERSEFWGVAYDAVILWTMPERVIPTFHKVLAGEEHSQEQLLAEVDSFAQLVRRVPATVRIIFVPSWVVPGVGRGLGPLELTNGVGVANTLMRMNLRLADHFAGDTRVVLLESARWMRAPAGGYDPKLWYLSKTPFNTFVFQEAAADVLAALNGIRGRSKKIIIVDLDDTLWGGVVGDVGWERLRLGGHDPVGEAFRDFQHGLKRLVNRGVILGIVSKNEEAVALEAIRRHPEMVLKIDDFAGWRINWTDKAQNITDLLADLNLGLDAAVFIDDSPFERGRVRTALPQVLVPDLPADPLQYPLLLSRLRCFDNPVISREDRARTSMYVADRDRSALKKDIESLDHWLEMLHLGVAVEPLSEENLERAAQLFNKTNQMNLTTRRLSPAQLLDWGQAAGHTVWTFRVWDKFGDYGLCGISSFVQNGSAGQLLDFVLSCRVMGRGVEEAMLAWIIRRAKDAGCQRLCAEYVPSARNQPCERWLRSVSDVDRQENKFIFSVTNLVHFPRHIQMRFGANETLASAS